jgi:hypothetical protein
MYPCFNDVYRDPTWPRRQTKLYKVESRSAKTGVKTYRHSIFLEKAFVEDSLFPFKAGENLIVKIDKDRLIITKFKP